MIGLKALEHGIRKFSSWYFEICFENSVILNLESFFSPAAYIGQTKTKSDFSNDLAN